MTVARRIALAATLWKISTRNQAVIDEPSWTVMSTQKRQHKDAACELPYDPGLLRFAEQPLCRAFHELAAIVTWCRVNVIIWQVQWLARFSFLDEDVYAWGDC